MDEPGWLTITEIARRLGRPPSTVAYWRDTFRDHLEARADEDGHACYRLAVFVRLDVLMRARTPRSEIVRELTERPPDAPADPFQAAILDRLDRLIEAVERIAAHLERGKEG